MVAIASPRNGIDRKLHRIALEAKSEASNTGIGLARVLAKDRFQEFSYQTPEGTKYASPETIAQYISFAKDLGLLDENGDCARSRQEIKQLENFQHWLSDTVMEYMSSHRASVQHITDVTRDLLKTHPCELPTLDSLHAGLKTPLTKRELRFCLQLLALLRPKLLRIKPSRLYLSTDVF